jgi:hypothetical protein
MTLRRDHRFDSPPVAAPNPLNIWLDGRWALLFSHPERFADYGFEADRWLVQLRDAFDWARVRPIAIGIANEAGWVSRTGGRYVPLHSVEDCLPTQWGTRTGRGETEHSVTIFDSSMRARRTFIYPLDGQTPSPIALAQTVARLRASSASTQPGKDWAPSWLRRNCS